MAKELRTGREFLKNALYEERNSPTMKRKWKWISFPYSFFGKYSVSIVFKSVPNSYAFDCVDQYGRRNVFYLIDGILFRYIFNVNEIVFLVHDGSRLIKVNREMFFRFVDFEECDSHG